MLNIFATLDVGWMTIKSPIILKQVDVPILNNFMFELQVQIGLVIVFQCVAGSLRKDL